MNKTPKRTTFTGIVVKDKRDKTITVVITRRVKHPLYGKYIKRSTKLHVHDPDNRAKMGDTVSVGQTRPLAKTKFFELLSIQGK